MARPVVGVQPESMFGHLARVQTHLGGYTTDWKLARLPARPEDGTAEVVVDCGHCPERFVMTTRSVEATKRRRFRGLAFALLSVVVFVLVVWAIAGPGTYVSVCETCTDGKGDNETASWVGWLIVPLILSPFMALTYVIVWWKHDGVTKFRRLLPDGKRSIRTRGHRLI